ncbi:MAG: glycoside hydrolase family 57 protein [Prevotellaceae bacterium]|jgi:alpha-amylase|nr:glycoside hydrolase family 57 protein [Prevotellaceae bacterium]
MKRTICFYFQVHQPFRLRRYRFFDIGDNHHYFDDFNNKSIMKKVAERSYLPMNKLLLNLIKEYGKRFKVAFSITGSAIEQFEMYAPEVLESFKKLAETGCVEFLAETSAHSLSVMKNDDEFARQIAFHRALIEKYFGQTPGTFRLTELVYSDEIGAKVAEMGFKTMLTEGARHVLGWKSPNFVYTNAIEPKLKVLLRNFRLSDDISFRFSDRGWAEWPVTSEKFARWLNELQAREEIVNLFMDYETFGEHQAASTGIFEFMKNLPKQVFSSTDFEFATPSEAVEKHQPVAPIHVPFPISWADEERDLSAWLGNELQDDAFDSLYALTDKIVALGIPEVHEIWLRLQNSDHFYYMCTKWFSDGNVHKYFNPYTNPYEAYINYMNVLSDFILFVNKLTDKKDDPSANIQDEMKKLPCFSLSGQQGCYFSTLTQKVSKSEEKRQLADPTKSESPLPDIAKKQPTEKKTAAKKAASSSSKSASTKKAATTKKATPAKKTGKEK